MGFTLNKKEFHDAVILRYDWQIHDIPSKCVCGERFDVNYAMICMKGGFVVQRHNELRDLEAELPYFLYLAPSLYLSPLLISPLQKWRQFNKPLPSI